MLNLYFGYKIYVIRTYLSEIEEINITYINFLYSLLFYFIVFICVTCKIYFIIIKLAQESHLFDQLDDLCLIFALHLRKFNTIYENYNYSIDGTIEFINFLFFYIIIFISSFFYIYYIIFLYLYIYFLYIILNNI